MNRKEIKSASTEYLVTRYIAAVLEHLETLRGGGTVKESNRQLELSFAIYDELEARGERQSFMTLLDHEDPRIRSSAACKLRRQSPEIAIPTMEKIEAGNIPRVSSDAKWSLFSFRKEFVEAQGRGMEGKNGSSRAARLAPKASASPLEHEVLKAASTDGLLERFIDLAISHIAAMQQVRIQEADRCSDAMWEIDEELTSRGEREKLATLLAHPDPHVRLAAACSVILFRPEDAIPVLETLQTGDYGPSGADPGASNCAGWVLHAQAVREAKTKSASGKGLAMPELGPFKLLRPEARKSASLDELHATLIRSKKQFLEHERHHPYGDGYRALVDDIVSELADRGVEGQAILLKFLEDLDTILGMDVARFAWRFAPEATIQFLEARAKVEVNGVGGGPANAVVSRLTQGRSLADEFERRAGGQSRLALLASLRDDGATPVDSARRAFAFYGLDPNDKPIYERLDALIDRMGLQRLRKEIHGLIRPGIGIAHVPPPKESQPGASHFGGSPELPPEMSWPSREGVPMALIAQIRLSDLASLPTFEGVPRTGMLYFFYDAEQAPWGEDDGPGAWRVLYHPVESGLVARRSREAVKYKKRGMAFAYQVTLPDQLDSAWSTLQLNISEEERELLQTLSDELRIMQPVGRKAVFAQLLGYPTWVQGHEPAPDDSGEPRRLLLQVGSDESLEMEWGDDGALYYWMTPSDLEALDFSKVIGHLESA